MCVTKIRWIVIGEWVACQIYIIWIFEECHSMKNQFSEMRPLPTCCLHFLLPFRNVMIWNWLLKDFVWVITMYSWLTCCTVSIFNSKWFYRMRWAAPLGTFWGTAMSSSIIGVLIILPSAFAWRNGSQRRQHLRNEPNHQGLRACLWRWLGSGQCEIMLRILLMQNVSVRKQLRVWFSQLI